MKVSVKIKCLYIKEKSQIQCAAGTYYFSFRVLALLELLLNKCAVFYSMLYVPGGVETAF